MKKTPAPPRRGDDDVFLASRRIIASMMCRNPELISRHCDPVACDVRTRALLYDLDVVEAVMAAHPRREKVGRFGT